MYESALAVNASGRLGQEYHRGKGFRQAAPLWRELAVLALAFIVLLMPQAALAATELVLFESEACTWCEQWDEEIAPTYPKTAEAKIAPLRRVDIHEELPADLREVKGVVFTPTFVLLHEGREIGRILGYPGEDFFWALLDELMVKLKKVQKSEIAACPKGANEQKIAKRSMAC